ncbi:hypothetical protein COC42_16275 [Sphingomonas spermidinifaciens]|uniref:Uncharacterized protein n=1 Tax=Sphingomonas spermidinifaciens TaxID=1141889 RepID=A0A2A4AXK1_9SPHN|nr:hypothetical protein [Sphingomonas spermidinifaciens]PCD01673.1 hypothetical protein COC42_16275 [Sphingomonas spermidinifaciens]
MRVAKILATAAMVSMTAAPAIAANSASKLSVAQAKTVRASSDSRDANKAVGSGVIIGVVAAAAVIGGIIIAADGDDSDSN